MTYYEKYQTLVDKVVNKAREGIVPASCAIAIQKSFEEWRSKASVVVASKEVKSIVHKCKSN
jgi:hypothetical protein